MRRSRARRLSGYLSLRSHLHAHSGCLVLIASCVWPLAVIAADEGAAPAAYQIVTGVTFEVLPEPLQTFFAAHGDTVRRVATGNAGQESQTRVLPGPVDSHYVMLDIAAAGPHPQARQAAVRAFPFEREAAQQLFQSHQQRRGGTLPWIIVERYAALVSAFRTAQADVIVTEAALLTHFATEAALPLNTTVNRDGSRTGHVRWPATRVRAASLHRTVRHRLQVVAIEHLRPRLEAEVRIWPRRVRPHPVPTKAVFDTLIGANDALDPLLALDASAMAELGITDGATFVAGADRYYQRVTEQAAPLLEARLEAGALLASRLIVTAWIEAGTPAVSSFTAPHPAEAPARTPEAAPAEQTEAAPGPFVASRNSTIFHRVGCPHAQRVKPENRVYFRSYAEARATGRTPCKTCNPEEP